MFEAAVVDEIRNLRFDPPAIVEQVKMLPYAAVPEAFVADLERTYERERKARETALYGLSEIMLEETYVDDPYGFDSIIRSFEKIASSVSKKLTTLEKHVAIAQKKDPRRDVGLDHRVLAVARKDFEERVEMALFFRAMQAKIWPTALSKTFTKSSDLGDALRAAIA